MCASCTSGELLQGLWVFQNQGCGIGVMESEGILYAVGVGKNVPTPTPTSI
jgi:hypothetical protein